MKKSLAEYMEDEKPASKGDSKSSDESKMEFGEMRLLHLFEKAFEPGFGGPDEGTHMERLQKRLKAFKELLHACYPK